MQLRGGPETCECRADHDVGPDRKVVEPFYNMVLAALHRCILDDFRVETVGTLSGGLEVLRAACAFVDPDRIAKSREVGLFGRGC